MQTFKDNLDRVWTISLNIANVKKIKESLKVNIMEAVEGDLLPRIATDPILLCDMIFVLCKEEADKKNISDIDFGKSMGGDAIEQATDAFLQELITFFPQRRRRLLKKSLNKMRDLESKILEHVEIKIDSPEIENRVLEELKNITT